MVLRRVLLVTATMSTLVLATACGGSNNNSAGGAGSATSATSSVSSASSGTGSSTSNTSSTSAPDNSSGSANYTKQGTNLAIGAKAVVPFASEGKTGAIGVTVTGIDKGDPADLAPLKLGDQANGMVPFYVRVTVSNETGTDFSNTSLGLMHGLLGDGSQAQGVSVIGTFDKCDSAMSGSAFTTKGATYTTCVLSVSKPDAPVTGASYDDTEYSKQQPNSDFGSSPITWK